MKDAAEEAEKEKKEKEAADKARDAEKKDIEGELEEEAPEGTGDEKMEEVKKANDSAYLIDSYKATIALAEIIAPGISFKTADAKLSPKKTLDAMCDLRRRTLQKGLEDEDVRAMITEVRGRALDSARLEKLSCPDVRHIFRSVGALVKAFNTNNVGKAATVDTSQGQGGTKGLTLAELNRKNAARQW
jgi:hypothetical protein